MRVTVTREGQESPPEDPGWLNRPLIEELRSTVAYLRHAMENNLMSAAAEAYNELSTRERMAINIAPKKCRDLGVAEVFTTKERAFINSPEFMAHRTSADNFTGDQM